jgi:uncharacterized protein (DUF1330 family)
VAAPLLALLATVLLGGPALAAPATGPATLVVTATPDPAGRAQAQAYLAGVAPLLVEAGGTDIRKLKTATVVGGRPAGLVLVADFPSQAAAQGLFASDAYTALVPARDAGFSEMSILITTDIGAK